MDGWMDDWLMGSAAGLCIHTASGEEGVAPSQRHRLIMNCGAGRNRPECLASMYTPTSLWGLGLGLTKLKERCESPARLAASCNIPLPFLRDRHIFAPFCASIQRHDCRRRYNRQKSLQRQDVNWTSGKWNEQ